MMKKLIYLTVILLISSISSSYGQNPIASDGTFVREIAPSEFKNYKGKLLIVPAFKAIGTKKWLTKRFEKFYGKPFHVADVSEVASGLGPDKYAIEEYKYMVFIQSSKQFGNTEYSFQLVDRSTNTVYYHPSSGNMVKKYIKKLLK